MVSSVSHSIPGSAIPTRIADASANIMDGTAEHLSLRSNFLDESEAYLKKE